MTGIAIEVHKAAVKGLFICDGLLSLTVFVESAMQRGERGDIGGRGDERGRLAEGDMTGRVIGLAIKVHKAAGPGLLEHVYEGCLCYDLERGGVMFERQVELPLIYEGIRFPRAYRADREWLKKKSLLK